MSTKAVDEGTLAGSVFVDLTKAFDNINHQILFLKLEAVEITGPALSLIRSYLFNRNQMVSIPGTYSKHKKRLTQGYYKGPLWTLFGFNLY